jgi:hypothetical protein
VVKELIRETRVVFVSAAAQEFLRLLQVELEQMELVMEDVVVVLEWQGLANRYRNRRLLLLE